MKKTLLLTTVCAALTACGGGSGGSNGGSDPTPTPTPTPTNVTCALPSEVTSGTTYYGPTVNGVAGTWSFATGSNGALNVTTTAGDTSNFSVTPTANGCTYTGATGDKGVAATFNEYGIVATTAVVNGSSKPALAVSNPVSAVNTTTFDQIKGTYLMAFYESQPSSFYRQVNIDSINGSEILGTIKVLVNGTWTTKHNIKIVSDSSTGVLKILVDDLDNNFVDEGISAYFKNVGSETIAMFGVHATANDTGIWVGTNKPVTTLTSGLYVDNGMDNTTVNQSNATSWVSVTSTTISANNSYTITPNVPATGFFGIADPGQTVPSVGVASALGLLSISDQYGPEVNEKLSSPPSFVFILKPKQTQQ